jgi:hypothetical protein
LKAFLLGAGASRGTFDDPVVPIASEFGRTLGALDPSWKQNYPALVKVVEHLQLDLADWPLEPVWSCIDYYVKLQPALPLQKPWNDEVRQLKKALLAVYGRRCDDLRAGTDSTLAKLFCDELQPGDVLISLNYDTIVERIARDLGRPLVLTPRGACGAVRFAKPHGSTSWTLDRKCHSVTWLSADGSPLLSSLRTSDVDGGREPLLLGAVPIKSELIREVQDHYQVTEVFNAISAQWRAVVEAVRDADTLVVGGYSFPTEDQYGRFLFGEGLRLRTGRLRIELFELRAKEAKLAKEVVRVFQGQLSDLVFRGPIVPRATA